jgi:beta-1,4-N-acetylglucosaminyltransferase
MILVTVGTHPQGFDRLVKAADDLAAQIEEPVVIQYGSSTYEPRHATAFRWTTSQEMERLTAEARVVISHAAAGSIITVLRMGKPLVLIPRTKQYLEHFDNHQEQLARALADQGRSVVVTSPSADSLRAAIDAALDCLSPNQSAVRLVAALRDALIAWQPSTPRPGT